MADELIMTSSRPYLVRALYEWISDNGMTPQILVDAGMPDVEVPAAYVRNGKIVLNISASATRNLDIGDRFLNFRARFGGVEQEVTVPMAAILAVYARETQAGMMFPPEDPPPADGSDGDKAGGSGSSTPHLRVIK